MFIRFVAVAIALLLALQPVAAAWRANQGACCGSECIDKAMCPVAACTTCVSLAATLVPLGSVPDPDSGASQRPLANEQVALQGEVNAVWRPPPSAHPSKH